MAGHGSIMILHPLPCKLWCPITVWCVHASKIIMFHVCTIQVCIQTVHTQPICLHMFHYINCNLDFIWLIVVPTWSQHQHSTHHQFFKRFVGLIFQISQDYYRLNDKSDMNQSYFLADYFFCLECTNYTYFWNILYEVCTHWTVF